MTSRLYHPKDYAKIRHWWTLHGQAEVPKNVSEEIIKAQRGE